MHTDVQSVGHFTCSNPLLNKIWDASMNAYLSNLHSIPTDCPQREKNGWTADAHVIGSLKNLLGPHYKTSNPEGLVSPDFWKRIEKPISASSYLMKDYGLMEDFDLVH